MDSNGYWALSLSVNGKAKHARVHCLMAEAFFGPRPLFMDVNHKDGDKLNNRIENLEWATELENTRHAHRLGLVPKAKGPAKLTPEQVREIRSLRGRERKKDIAKQFGVCVSTIGNVWYGTFHADVE